MSNTKKDEIREEVYRWALDLYKEGHEYESIILLLSTWNFAYFRFILTSFNLKNFKRDLANLEKEDFVFFNKKSFKDIRLDDKKTVERIMRIYNTISNSGIKQVGATKVMHLLKPDVFVMWDNGIIKHYSKTYKNDKIIGKIDKTAEGYINFMRLMQNLYMDGKFHSLDTKFTIPRAIDLYNLKWQSGNNKKPNKVKCPKCGKQNPSRGNYCPKCGTKLQK